MGRRYRDERQLSDSAMHELLWHRRVRLPGSIEEARSDIKWWNKEESICTVSVHTHWIHTPPSTAGAYPSPYKTRRLFHADSPFALKISLFCAVNCKSLPESIYLRTTRLSRSSRSLASFSISRIMGLRYSTSYKVRMVSIVSLNRECECPSSRAQCDKSSQRDWLIRG